MKKLPIGISDYKTVITENYYYIDKTLLIKELYESSAQVILLPRPRRFGKTLNLSMLHYFYEKSEQSNDYLFIDTAIKRENIYSQLQGKYPIIFLTFKDIKSSSFEEAYENLKIVIASEFKRHKDVIWPNLDDIEKSQYNSIISMTSSPAILSNSLFFLSELLFNYHKKQVIFLLDEYDTPIHSGYEHNFYKEIVKFMATLLSKVLKDNKYLAHSVITGILRTAKEGIFSGLNNLNVYGVNSLKFQDKFGFTQNEIDIFLAEYNLTNKNNEIQQWYNGYIFGENIIYNPWSVLNCIDSKGELKSYWANTSNNSIIRKILIKSNEEFKSDFELLLLGNSITKIIEEGFVFPEIEGNENALWSLLLYTGYLTYSEQVIKEGKVYCDLIIPNKEIKLLFDDLVNQIINKTLTSKKFNSLLNALTNGDIAEFTEILQEFIINSISVYDIPSNEPEKSYHLFILGLLSYLSQSHEIKSNRESGYGRYDIMIIPKNIDNLAIVIEFKKAANKEMLKESSKNALEQIKNKYYIAELKQRSIKKILIIGIAFHQKEIYTTSEYIS